jgi:hypothetical protein
VYVGVPTTGTVGQVNYLAHVQYEDWNFPSSRIVTGAASATREADDLYLASEHQRTVWGRDRGTLLVEVKMPAPNTDMDRVDFVFIQVHDNAPSVNRDAWALFHTSGSLTGRKRVASTAYSANYVTAWAAGDTLKLALRWRSTEREHADSAGAAAYDRTFEVFLNGVSVAEYASASPPDFDAWQHKARVRIGHRWDNSSMALLGHIFGWVRDFEFFDYVMSADEIADKHR